jgi:hypothetical protein
LFTINHYGTMASTPLRPSPRTGSSGPHRCHAKAHVCVIHRFFHAQGATLAQLSGDTWPREESNDILGTIQKKNWKTPLTRLKKKNGQWSMIFGQEIAPWF